MRNRKEKKYGGNEIRKRWSDMEWKRKRLLVKTAIIDPFNAAMWLWYG